MNAMGTLAHPKPHTVVFLGPSLPLAEAQSLCAADYRPPVQMGDVYRATQDGARLIVIIDGLFERIPAVWHKEILHAISRGITVVGGGSMGALRAAELHPFGMIGVGAIQADYAAGILNDDDEVAVAHAMGDSGYRPLSTAMVNLRYGVRDAVGAGVIDAATADRLLDRAKALFYPDRSWDALLADAATLAPAAHAGLAAFIANQRPDQKRDDAIAVLEAAAALQARPAPRPANFAFEHTVYWETIETYCGRMPAPDTALQAVGFERVRNHVRLFEPDRERLTERALLLFLAEQEARRMRLPQPEDRQALTAFRARRGLATAAALAEWMSASGIDRPACLQLARTEARLDAVRQRLIAKVDAQLPSVLQLESRLPRIVAAVQNKWQAVAEQAIGGLNADDVEAFSTILSWYVERHGPVYQDLSDHASSLGIGSYHQWREEVLAEYITQTAAD